MLICAGVVVTGEEKVYKRHKDDQVAVVVVVVGERVSCREEGTATVQAVVVVVVDNRVQISARSATRRPCLDITKDVGSKMLIDLVGDDECDGDYFDCSTRKQQQFSGKNRDCISWR